jgi:predicted Zn-dependent protease
MGVGLFPDLRLGRAAIARRAANRRVLNLFSYTGAFSVAAAKAGASEVVAVDLAAKAHARARRNYELSGLDPKVMEAITGDTLKTLDRFIERKRRFDIVICNRDFEGSDYSGQDLLDELRRENLLPHSTVFLMVVQTATYHQVMEAAEAALDGLLVRPYTAAVLSARLLEARNRKRELSDVLRALDAGQPEQALIKAVHRFQEQQPYWLYCGRLAAELLLTLQRPAEGRKLFERLLQAKPKASWARLGVARAQMACGEMTAARKTVTEVLSAEPGSADAHDLMGRILVDQCDFDGALAEYSAAVVATPGCLLRAQHAGALAFYQGKSDDALKYLEER